MITELRKTRDTTKEWDVKDLESDWFILSHSHGEDILGMYNVTLYTILTNNKTLYTVNKLCVHIYVTLTCCTIRPEIENVTVET